MRALLSRGRFAVLRAFSAVVMVFAVSGVAGAAEIYLYGDFRGSFGSGEFSGYLDAAPTPRAISGEDGDWSWSFALALGIAQSLEKWELWGRSLDGWALRGEIEFGPRRDYELSTSGPLGPGSVLGAHIKARTLMGDFWLDFPIHRELSGYAGFGVGVAGASISAGDRGYPNDYWGSRKEREFAFQVGAGFEYPLLENLRVSLGYRYVHLGGYEADLVNDSGNDTGRVEVDLASHELLVGLRLSFDILPSPFD